MTIFPDNLIVSTPPGHLEEQSCPVILRLFDVREGAQAIAARYGERIRHIDTDARTLAALDSFDLLAEYKIRLAVEDRDLPLVHEIARNAVRHSIVLLVRPDAAAARRLNLLGEFNITMHIDPSVAPAEAGIPKALL
jgi:hypothetical protein